MPEEKVKCLYCQTSNNKTELNCQHCGMPLAKEHPNSAKTKHKIFKPFFIIIVIFAIVMVFYLPR